MAGAEPAEERTFDSWYSNYTQPAQQHHPAHQITQLQKQHYIVYWKDATKIQKKDGAVFNAEKRLQTSRIPELCKISQIKKDTNEVHTE